MSPVSYISDRLVVAKWGVLMRCRTIIVNSHWGIPIVQVGGDQTQVTDGCVWLRDIV